MAGRKSISVLAAGILLFALPAQADLTISSKPTQNVSCSAGVCTATDKKAVLNVDQLTAMLSTGDATVSTGGIAKDIEVSAPLSWASTSRLTLDADKSLIVKKPVTVAGTGALTISTNGGHQKVDLEFFGKGSVQFWDLSSSLVINGKSYTLVGDIATLAAGIAANPSGNFALAKDYDASADGTYSLSPIQTTFTGTFDGLGNAISDFSLTGNKETLYGFFQAVVDSGTIRNFGLAKIDIRVTQFSGLGALVGSNAGIVSRSWSSGNVELGVGAGAGGLVGGNSGAILESYANIKLHGHAGHGEHVGGLVGINDVGSIEDSYALGSVKYGGGESDVGGLVGLNGGMIGNSFARNAIVAGRDLCCVGYFGGLVGRNLSTGMIATSYAAGPISRHNNNATLGGLIGFDEAAPGSIENSDWDLDMGVSDPSQGAGNVANDPGITGLTTSELQSSLPEGFDVRVWALRAQINDGFPYLRVLP
jgi:GLUG motif-containing protein